MTKVTGDQFLEIARGDERLHGWQPLLGQLKVRYLTGGFTAGLALVQAITEAAEDADHHPDVTLTYPHVELRLFSHDVGHITDRDVALATRIGEIAAGQGVAADPDVVQTLEIGLDGVDHPALRRFWAAVLGVDDGGDDEVVDPTGNLPGLWLQETDAHAEPRQRFHLDLTVPEPVAAGRIEAALAAGGTLVDDSQAPGFTVLADPEGNKVCICTQVGRPV